MSLQSGYAPNFERIFICKRELVVQRPLGNRSLFTRKPPNCLSFPSKRQQFPIYIKHQYQHYDEASKIGFMEINGNK